MNTRSKASRIVNKILKSISRLRSGSQIWPHRRHVPHKHPQSSAYDRTSGLAGRPDRVMMPEHLSVLGMLDHAPRTSGGMGIPRPWHAVGGTRLLSQREEN
ncbi:hypothetical protein GCM10023322_52840 [Rugosimonospora acidiphila]|uniref:Uncharacterized protein n=1 Tax=Rugosimonospora acidiphila TaxID=556531 RepID=A0ABP9S8A6_9ACTN